MIFLSEFSLLSLGHLANSKQGEQYKNNKLSAYIQTFQKNRKKSTEITVWKFWLVVDFAVKRLAAKWLAKTFP